MDDITAFILAGGRSTRMGADKAFLDWHGRPLIEHALELARHAAGRVCIAGSGENFGVYGEVVEDAFAERGPLAGIHSALTASASELNLVLAVDMPLIEPRFLEYLVVQARGGSAVVTVPRVAGGWQPLCAVYRREFRAAGEAALHAGRNKIDALFAGQKLRIIDEQELGRFAFPLEMFDNLNTPEEWQRARSRQVHSR